MLASMSLAQKIEFKRKNRKAIFALVVALAICFLSIAMLYYSASKMPVILRVGPLSVSFEVTDDPWCSVLMISCPRSLQVAPGRYYFSSWGMITTKNKNGGEHHRGKSIFRIKIP